jgi:DNA-directed RNA polymerase subunit E'/Rpb7
MNEDSKNEQPTPEQPLIEVESTNTVKVEEKLEAIEKQDGSSSPDQAVNMAAQETSAPQATVVGISTGVPTTSDVADTQAIEAAYDHSLKAFSEGEIVKGTVMTVDRDTVMIDIGFKSEGYIPVSEFKIGADGLPNVRAGDVIDVYIVRREDSEGQLVLSKEIADQKLIWDEIAKAYDTGQPVQGKIVKRIKGGLQVDVGTLRAFLPASQIELRPVQDMDKYVGMTLDMKVSGCWMPVEARRRVPQVNPGGSYR